jgi:glycosyltransferase involved in cell wall biosynthesis
MSPQRGCHKGMVDDMKNIRLYGTTHPSSFQVVSDGLREGLEEVGRLAGFVALNREHREEAAGANAKVAIVVGNPYSVIQTHFLGNHEEIWLMLAPNSEGVPAEMVKTLSNPVYVRGARQLITGFYTPSSWGKEVLQRAFPSHPVRVFPHGVSSEFFEQRLTTPSKNDTFKVLHVSSTLHERKGTRELITAWARAIEVLGDKSHLAISCLPNSYPVYQDFVAKSGAHKTISLHPCGDRPVKVWAKMVRDADFVCQPSRGEGFGMVPLEARALGVPVIATLCTGHGEHMSELTRSVVPIAHGELAPVDDFKGAIAPSVSVQAIVTALLYAKHNQEELTAAARADAKEVQEQWSWASVCKRSL